MAAAASSARLRASAIAARVAAIFPAEGSLNENVGPLIVLAPALVAPSMTDPTILIFVTWIASDSLAVHWRSRCLAEPTRTIREETLTSSVWMSLAGTPTERIARTTASVPRLAADSAWRELTAERATETDRSATSGATNTEPEPSTLSVPAVVSAPAAGTEIKATAATAATAHLYLRMPLPSFGFPPQTYTSSAPRITLCSIRDALPAAPRTSTRGSSASPRERPDAGARSCFRLRS